MARRVVPVPAGQVRRPSKRESRRRSLMSSRLRPISVVGCAGNSRDRAVGGPRLSRLYDRTGGHTSRSTPVDSVGASTRYGSFAQARQRLAFDVLDQQWSTEPTSAPGGVTPTIARAP